MRLFILICVLLLAQVSKKPEQPVQPSNPETAAQEIPKQIEPLPALPNSVSGSLAAPPGNSEKTNTTNCCDNSNHLITYTNLIFTGLIALFAYLTWSVYKGMLRATKINERAWIVPMVGELKPTKNAGLFQIEVELINTGKTPAWIVAAGSSGKGATEQEPLPTQPPYVEMKSFTKKGTLLSPNGAFTQGFPITKERLDHVQAGTSQLFIFGYVRYRDIYEDTHIARYCFEARKSHDLNHSHPLEFYTGGPNGYMEAD
jgi:hypothetical protein